MKKQELIVIGIIGAIVGLAYWLYSRQKRQPSGQPVAPKGKDCFPIEYGNTEPCPGVLKMQRWLNRLNVASLMPPIAEDGLWGPETAESLRTHGYVNFVYGSLAEDELNQLITTWIYSANLFS